MAAIAGLAYVVIDKYANDATKQSLMSSAGEFIISGPVQSLVGFILGLFGGVLRKKRAKGPSRTALGLGPRSGRRGRWGGWRFFYT